MLYVDDGEGGHDGAVGMGGPVGGRLDNSHWETSCCCGGFEIYTEKGLCQVVSLNKRWNSVEYLLHSIS